jgi:hypothetical protein
LLNLSCFLFNVFCDSEFLCFLEINFSKLSSLKAYQPILCFYTRWETIEISQFRKEQTAFQVVRPRVRQIEARVSEGKIAMNVTL